MKLVRALRFWTILPLLGTAAAPAAVERNVALMRAWAVERPLQAAP